MLDSLAVLVNTSDGFTDCWIPFFHLFERYGGELRRRPVYLNTERAHYAWPGLAVQTTRVWKAGEDARPSWSECLLRGLDAVPDAYVLYMQEDYFLTGPVIDDAIAESLSILERDPSIGVVYLNKYGPQFRRSSPYAPRFVEIVPPARYLVSTQAAIWRKGFLTSLARPWENGWMFEKFGTLRASRRDARMISVHPHVMRETPVVEYVYTGVMKGQWHVDCVALFEKHGIQVDFDRRGFYREAGRLKSRLEVLRKMIARPADAAKSIVNLVGNG